ncbi:type IV pilus modification PilV family protein [Inediibacterium massiliense]|uniref:type IV pilus modification PilV family protein n=1 Tax=Inediibacterium massiliense TaxID=1658111 RepID=UPI0006B66BF1|nr:prepilin-type N-terminal cleavage/methylation domain-containing protein [Inediibacterium massiliense]
MNKKGFTFIEVLISLTLLSFMITTTFPLCLQINTLYQKSKVQYELGNLAESYMEEVKASGNISIENHSYSLDDFMKKEMKFFLQSYEIKIIAEQTHIQGIIQIHFRIADHKTKEKYELSSYMDPKKYKDDYESFSKE